MITINGLTDDEYTRRVAAWAKVSLLDHRLSVYIREMWLDKIPVRTAARRVYEYLTPYKVDVPF